MEAWTDEVWASYRKTKVSDFEVADIDGNDKTEDILNYPGFSFMIIAYKLNESVVNTTRIQRDSVFVLDSVLVGKTYQYNNVFDRIVEKPYLLRPILGKKIM